MTPHLVRRRADAEAIRAGHRLTFTGQYTHDPDGTWFVRVPEVYAATRALRFDEIEDAVRTLVALTLDVDGDAFDVRLEPAA
jgi:hypothetical protein